MTIEVRLLLAKACSLRHLVLRWETALLWRLHISCCLWHEPLEAGLLGISSHLLLRELLLLLQAL